MPLSPRSALRLGALALATAAGAAAQPAGAPADDDLAAFAALLDEPIETAATYRQRSSEAPASVAVVTADEIERAGYQTLADVLATVRGLYVSNDRNYAYVGVRGLGRPSDYNNRIAVLIDGVSAQETGFYGSASIESGLGVPLSAVDRVEVVRGPGSTLYGTGAMFAVVNVILKDTRALDGVSGVVSASEYGGLRGEAVASTRAGGAGVSVAVFGLDDDGPDVYFPEFDAPESAGGVAVGLDYERAFGALAAVDAGPVRLDVRVSQRTKGVPTGPFEAVFGLDASTVDRIAVAALRAEGPLSPSVAAFAMGTYTDYYYTGSFPYDDGDGAGPYWALDDTHGGRARAEGRLRWDAHAAHRVVVGAEAAADVKGRYRTFLEGEPPSLALDGTYESGAVYGQLESQLGRSVTVTAGTRLDVVRRNAAVSPRGALVVTPDERTALKLIAGTAFRAPSTYELTFADSFSGVAVAGDLGPERVATVEALASREVTAGLRVEASVFATRVEDLIDLVGVGTGWDVQFQNVGRADTRGAEAGLAVAAAGWRARASYGLQDARDPATDARLTNAPVHLAKAAAHGPLGRRLWLSADAQAESGRRTVYGTTTGAYAVVNAALSADVVGGAGRVTLGVRNALDADYALPGGFEHAQAAIPQRPRTLYLRLDVRL